MAVRPARRPTATQDSGNDLSLSGKRSSTWLSRCKSAPLVNTPGVVPRRSASTSARPTDPRTRRGCGGELLIPAHAGVVRSGTPRWYRASAVPCTRRGAPCPSLSFQDVESAAPAGRGGLIVKIGTVALTAVRSGVVDLVPGDDLVAAAVPGFPVRMDHGGGARMPDPFEDPAVGLEPCGAVEGHVSSRCLSGRAGAEVLGRRRRRGGRVVWAARRGAVRDSRRESAARPGETGQCGNRAIRLPAALLEGAKLLALALRVCVASAGTATRLSCPSTTRSIM